MTINKCINKENAIVVDLESGFTKEGKLNLSKEQLHKSSSILANILLEYARKGGDMSNLTPKSVFGKK